MSVSFYQNFGQVELAFEAYEPKPGQTVYYIKPVDKSFKGFFMEIDSEGKWKVINRHAVPWEIICLEHFMSAAITQHRLNMPLTITAEVQPVMQKTRIVYSISCN